MLDYRKLHEDSDKRQGNEVHEININITRAYEFLKKTFKKKPKKDYEWIYECQLHPLYRDTDKFCVPDLGFRSEPYCKHGYRLIRVDKNSEKQGGEW